MTNDECTREETVSGGGPRTSGTTGVLHEPAAAAGTPATPEASTSTNGERDVPAALAERLDALGALIDARIGRVLEAFEAKIAYDESKQVQVDRLHEELQQHRSDLVGRAVRPLVLDVIRLHDNIGKLVSALREKPRDELSAERFFRLLEGLQQDVELMLEHNGVHAFREETGGRLDHVRQRILKTVATSDREIGGTVAASVRPGFEQDGRIVERERVAVYRLEAPPPATPAGEPPQHAPESSHPAADPPEPAAGGVGEPATIARTQGQED